ncbi:hypothetical protein GCM10028791_18330 [Echinicola sediminis]
MKKLLLLSFFLIHSHLQAQDKTNWDFGIAFSLDQLNLGDGMGGIITQGNANGYGVNFDRTNFSLGVNGRYPFWERLGLSSGIIYSNKDFTGTYDCAACSIASSNYFFYAPEKIEQQFLTIPLSLDYSILTGKLRPVLLGGVKHNVEIKNGLEAYSKGYFLEGFLGAALYYRLVEKVYLGMGYRYQTALSDLYKTDDFKLRTSSFFIEVNYSFR